MTRSALIFGLTAFNWMLAGCAGKAPIQHEDPKLLIGQACAPGRDIQSVQGSVWLKAKSKDASGQFPATVAVKTPNSLKMEVTNLIGGTEAIISIDGKSYRIDMPSRKDKTIADSSGYWAGIPLRWATDLFLGKIPCPTEAALSQAKLSATPEGDLVVDVPAGLEKEAERFTYRFRTYAGKPWPESLHWQRLGTVPVNVEMTFDDPEDHTDSPRKWEAKSDRGEVKVRWKDRQLTPG
jgi:hypothetical protein